MKLFLALLAFATAGVAQVNSPAPPAPQPTYALLMPHAMLQLRHDREEGLAFIFGYVGDVGNAAYFKGRQDVYAELIALLKLGIPATSEL